MTQARRLEDLALLLLTVAGMGAVALIIFYFANYGNWFIHPHQFEVHLPKLLTDGPDLHFGSFANIFQQFDPSESRPRFLAYLIILLNLHLRMWLYDWLVLYPPLSLGWVFEIFVGPILLYRLLGNLTNDRAAQLSGVLIYITSIGFLSGFAMPLMPSKPLSNVVFIAVLYLCSELKKFAVPGQLLQEVPAPKATKLLLGLVLFAGLMLDEVPIFALLLPFLFFYELFIPRWKSADRLRRLAMSSMVIALPVLLFLVLTILAVPAITKALYGYQFDFIASVFVNKAAGEAGKSFFSGGTYGFGLESLKANLFSLFGSALVPWQYVPFTKHPAGSGVVTGQESDLPVMLATIAVLATMTALALKSASEPARYLRRALVTVALFVLFMSLLSGRHVPFIIGYVYGCGFAVFLSVLIGLTVSLTNDSRTRIAAVALVIVLSAVQLNNFAAINRSWIHLHNEGWARPNYQGKLPVAQDERKTTRLELRAIWEAWSAGRLPKYLQENQISSGAIFLVFELRHLEKWRPPGGTSRSK